MSSAYSSDSDQDDSRTTFSAPASTSYRPNRPIAPLPHLSSSVSESGGTSPVARAPASPAPAQQSAQARPAQAPMRHALPAKPTGSLPPAQGSNGAAGPSQPKRVRTDSTLVPQAPKIPKTLAERDTTPRLIVVLEQACLETYKISSGSASRPRGGREPKDGGDKYALLNCDDHQRVLAKMGRDIADARPDITHQVSCATICRGAKVGAAYGAYFCS